ncbi:MAG: MFS transporter, partial [Firmicutes bacterium]|nr:MFS transporter [Bacillota bacterium]
MKNSLYYNYIALYALTYAAMGGVFPLIGQYLDDIGFSGTQIGTITGAGTFAAIFATAFWGSVYNRARSKSGVVMFLFVATAIICMLLPTIRLYLVFLIAYAGMYFFQQPVNALSDAMVMEDGERFNAIRMWGAIGYSVSVFIAGRLSNTFGTQVIFI